MKYTLISDAPPQKFEEFAEKNNLEIEVRERNLDSWTRSRGLPQYIAKFKKCEVKDGGCLKSEYGDGNTPEEAIQDYADKIRGELLVVDSYGANRRTIRCPNRWL